MSVLAVRLDSDGDVLLTGPAIRRLAAIGGPVDVLASPQGEHAARLLPGVRDVLRFAAPWSGFDPPAVDSRTVAELVRTLEARAYDLAVVFTSFHQSPLPMALVARLAGIPRIAATSEDYPGSLLDVRHRRDAPPGGGHEVEAAVELAVAAGAPAPAGDDDLRLAVRRPLPTVPDGLLPAPALDAATNGRLLVLHPGASVPSRGLRAPHAGAIAAALAATGRTVAVTGAPGERELVTGVVAAAAGAGAAAGALVDLAGRTSLAELASVIDLASCTVVGNTGPAHLSAAVGTPVVSLFSPVVPPERWAPWGVGVELLGDQHAPCRDSRARECPVPGHPCLTSVTPQQVVAAVDRLTAPGGTGAEPRED